LTVFVALLAALAFATAPEPKDFPLANRNGTNWQFQSEAANRLTNTITPLNRQTTLGFNPIGLVSTIKRPSTPNYRRACLCHPRRLRARNSNICSWETSVPSSPKPVLTASSLARWLRL
jgi:hypothetical protein